MIEIHKANNQLNSAFMIKIFGQKAVPYQVRSAGVLNLPEVRTTYDGTHAIRLMGQRAWAKLLAKL